MVLFYRFHDRVDACFLVEGGGFEPPKLSRQIYSLIPLATREPLRKAAYCPDGMNPCQPVSPNKIIDLESVPDVL